MLSKLQLVAKTILHDPGTLGNVFRFPPTSTPLIRTS